MEVTYLSCAQQLKLVVLSALLQICVPNAMYSNITNWVPDNALQSQDTTSMRILSLWNALRLDVPNVLTLYSVQNAQPP